MRKKPGPQTVAPPDGELKDLYFCKKLSYSQIAKKYGVAFQTVGKWMKKYGLMARPWSTRGLGYMFIGHKISEETKEKISKAHTGKVLSPEHKEKVLEPFRKRWKDVSYPIGTIVGVNTGKRGFQYKSIKVSDHRWKYLHRYLVEQEIGRELSKGEEVHHINFNPEDNDIKNLLLIERSEHLKLHSQLERVMKELMSRGIVGFDGKQYFVK